MLCTGSWTEHLARITEREEKKWGAILIDVTLSTLHNWALLQLFNSVMDAPKSENGRQAFLCFKEEIERRFYAGELQQWEIDQFGVNGPAREVVTT